jgi:hypothetical protein
MAHLTRKQIQERAFTLLREQPGGLRWGQMLKLIHHGDPETPPNSIQGALHALLISTDKISKVARGTYQLTEFVDQAVIAPDDECSDFTPAPPVAAAPNAGGLYEADFYQSFAEWLIDGAEEANEAEAIGGNILKGKWGTPDVIGVLKARADDILKFPTQVVSAEIKIDPGQPVTAFGQSVAYRLFSHKSYIVVPNGTSQDDLARLKALCGLHGVGLVTFTLDVAAPDYSIVVQAQHAEPDMFYANQMAKRLRDTSPKTFHRFFS